MTMKETIYVGCMDGSGKVLIETDGNIVIDAPTIFNRFIGNTLIALTRWAKGQGGYSCEREA